MPEPFCGKVTEITAAIDLDRLRARDPALMEHLVRDLNPRIRAAIWRYARDNDDADDLVQECWVHILERLDRYEARGSFAGWAIAVARNVCKTRLRRDKRATESEVSLDDVGELSAGGMDPVEDLLLHRQRQSVYAALDRLPDRERDAIVLRLLEERGTAETAGVLGVSDAAVRSILQRGLARLRRMKEVRELLMDWVAVD